MQIDNLSTNPNFKAKLVQTKDLRKVVQYVKDNPKNLQQLIEAEQNISRQNSKIKVNFELFQTPDGYPFVMFTRYIPQKGIKFAEGGKEDFIDYEPIIIQSKKIVNPLKFGFDMIQRLGFNAPNNSLYKNIVLGDKSPVENKIYKLA